MYRIVLSAVASLSLAGCVVLPETQFVPMTSSFSASEAAYIFEEGDNIIEGFAMMRTRGGDSKTCAGSEVSLIPASSYAIERVRLLYGSATTGVRYPTYYGATEPERTEPDYSQFVAHMTNRVCDPQGNFTFEDVADGDYFVVSEVYWEVPGQYGMSLQGGAMMRRVSVEGGETAEIQMVP